MFGPLVSLRCRLNGARSLASCMRACCLAMHQWPERRYGRRPRTPPRVPYPLARDCSGETPTCFDSSSRHLATSTPLPPTAFLSREDLLGASPLHPTPASSSPPRAPPQPGVPLRPLQPHRWAPLRPLTGALLSTELTATANTHRWASLHPKPQIGFPTSPSHSSPTASATLSSATAEIDGRRRYAGGGKFPLFWPRAEIFLSNYSNSILIKVQTSKSVGNCMDLIKL
jgi:hypothetical protein